MLLSVSWDQTARFWSLPRGQQLGPALQHMASVANCAWSPDSRHVATLQNDGLLRVWQRPGEPAILPWDNDLLIRLSFKTAR